MSHARRRHAPRAAPGAKAASPAPRGSFRAGRAVVVRRPFDFRFINDYTYSSHTL